MTAHEYAKRIGFNCDHRNRRYFYTGIKTKNRQDGCAYRVMADLDCPRCYGSGLTHKRKAQCRCIRLMRGDFKINFIKIPRRSK